MLVGLASTEVVGKRPSAAAREYLIAVAVSDRPLASVGSLSAAPRSLAVAGEEVAAKKNSVNSVICCWATADV